MRSLPSCLVATCALIAGATPAFAQITITSADMPQPNVTYPLENAVLAFADYAAAGPDVTWDFSNLTGINEAPLTPLPMSAASLTAGVAFNSPFNAAYQCDYFLPTALPAIPEDIGFDIPLDGFNAFYQTSGDHFAIAGLGLSASGFDLPVQYADIDEWFPLPFAYGETFNSSGAFELNIPELLGYAVDQTRSVTADAWGTLILPDGPHEVLRIRTELEATDAFTVPQLGEDPIVIDRSQVIYSWYGVGSGFPLLEVTETFGVAANVTFQNLEASPNAVSNWVSTSPALLLGPNPLPIGAELSWSSRGADGDASQRGPWRLLDMSGRIVQTGTDNNLQGEMPGLFLLQLSDGSTHKVMFTPRH